MGNWLGVASTKPDQLIWLPRNVAKLTDIDGSLPRHASSTITFYRVP